MKSFSKRPAIIELKFLVKIRSYVSLTEAITQPKYFILNAEKNKLQVRTSLTKVKLFTTSVVRLYCTLRGNTRSFYHINEYFKTKNEDFKLPYVLCILLKLKKSN